MKYTHRILLKSLVREFYRRNAGLFIFIFILFIGAVGELEGTLKYTGPLHQFHYQYALILGLLSSRTFFILVLLAWFLYAEKCTQFVLAALQHPDFSFLNMLNSLPPKKKIELLYQTQFLLFLPITLYSLAILGVALYKGWYLSGLAIIGYIPALCLLGPARYRYQLQHPDKPPLLPRLLPSIPGARYLQKSATILLRSLVRPFYRQNAGFFLFLFILFFGVVAPSQQLAYHYALILGLLEAPLFLGIVLLAWLLYAFKCDNWVLNTLDHPEFSFLNMLSRLDKRWVFFLLLGVQIVLYLPISLYALVITGVALYKDRVGVALFVQLYIVLLSLAEAWRYGHKLYHPGGRSHPLLSRLLVFLPSSFRRRLSEPKKRGPSYWSFFIRYLFRENKALLLGLKISGCSLLYLLLRDPDPDYYDIRMPFLLYSIVLFGHGVLIYRCRELEEKRLLFYRGLPVSLLCRFFQIACLYFLVLIPEMITIAWLVPASLRLKDALGFILSGYGLLLLLSSLLGVVPLKMGDFLKLSLGVFGILYLGVLGGILLAMGGFFFVAAGSLFWWGYGR